MIWIEEIVIQIEKFTIKTFFFGQTHVNCLLFFCFEIVLYAVGDFLMPGNERFGVKFVCMRRRGCQSPFFMRRKSAVFLRAISCRQSKPPSPKYGTRDFVHAMCKTFDARNTSRIQAICLSSASYKQNGGKNHDESRKRSKIVYLRSSSFRVAATFC